MASPFMFLLGTLTHASQEGVRRSGWDILGYPRLTVCRTPTYGTAGAALRTPLNVKSPRRCGARVLRITRPGAAAGRAK